MEEQCCAWECMVLGLESKQCRQTNRQTGRGKLGGAGRVVGGGGGVLFPEDVSDCLAGWCWVSALDWRNQVDRKGGSEWGRPERVVPQTKKFVWVWLGFHAAGRSADILKCLLFFILTLWVGWECCSMSRRLSLFPHPHVLHFQCTG